ncbi:hypothetical protein HGRIS_000901 [Hohenbuehelia grisea]|uniref:RlpA-like protein double-psi beta-barrel domain-containing protein n=1 Tax=Hohenbuehelia grisea TaxID=104357 RepID=A0ABR3IQ48_9AGAR
MFSTKLAGVFSVLALAVGMANAAAVDASAAAFGGDATYYYTGLGACGAYSQNSDFIVALPPSQYNNGANCWRHIKVQYQGRTIDATVVDLCPGCGGDSIDLSPGAFQALSSLDAGRIRVTWNWA